MVLNKKYIIKLFTFMSLFLLMPLASNAFEDYIVTTDGTLTDISIEDNTVVDVYPLITIMNKKNTLFFHPLKTGQTQVSVLKNGKEKVIFNVKITEFKTTVDNVNGFELLSLDVPPDFFELDEPPMMYKEVK